MGFKGVNNKIVCVLGLNYALRKCIDELGLIIDEGNFCMGSTK